MFKKLLIIFILLSFSMPAMAFADYYTFDEANHTALIYKNSQKWLEVKSLGAVSDITENKEILQVRSNYNYPFSVLDDFKEDYEIHK